MFVMFHNNIRIVFYSLIILYQKLFIFIYFLTDKLIRFQCKKVFNYQVHIQYF